MSEYRPVRLTITIDVSMLSLIEAEQLQTSLWIPPPLKGECVLDVVDVA